ncbi:unnamed protein product, partial [Iphiclides podalirius]
MAEIKSILHELYVFSEWKPEPEYLQKSDSILPENISAVWRWFKFFGPKKSLIDSVSTHKEKQQKWHIALGDEGKVLAVLTDNILEIRTKRSEYATIAARTTVSRDPYAQWRKLVWSPDCSFLVLAYGNGVVSFFDLTASNLFNIPADCSRPGGLECTDNTHAKYLKLLHRYRNKRVLNDDPFYKLSVVSDQLEARLANEKFQLYIPYITTRTLNFVVRMEVSADGAKLVCVHCNGDVSLWRLPLLRLERRWPLQRQPHHRLESPLRPQAANNNPTHHYHPADVNWWSEEEIILARFSGAVSVCDLEELNNILGKGPEFFQGTPQVTRAHEGAFMVLECESNILPAKKSRSDESMEVVKVEEAADDSTLELTKELLKTVLYAITDMETFQPKPKKITVVSRIYRLLGVKSTTPDELFSRKIESGHYAEALALADRFGLDSDLVYQQQWRKNPVSTHAIHNYLSKVSKKIWAVHQCVDRLPETLSAAKELLQFGLQLTNERILDEINKDRDEDEHKDPNDITLEDLNAYTSELLRCRHVMLYYRERLSLYESILSSEKCAYNKEEYARLRSGSVVRSAVELAKEGRVEALTCLWPLLRGPRPRLAVLDWLPETLNPVLFQHLLPSPRPLHTFAECTPVHFPTPHYTHDWCRKRTFRSIWSSDWSEEGEWEGGAEGALGAAEGEESEGREESETGADEEGEEEEDAFGAWCERRARQVVKRTGLASHALALVSLAALGGGVQGLDHLIFHLLTLTTLLYDLNVEEYTLRDVEAMSTLDTCTALMKVSTPESFVADLKEFVVPYLKRYERLMNRPEACLYGLMDFLESKSVTDLSHILLVLQSPTEFELDIRTHLELAERCLFAHNSTDQLDMACDLLNTILKESDGSISTGELVRRVAALERLVGGASRLAWRGLRVPLRELRDLRADADAARRLLARLARDLAKGEKKPTPQDWENLLKDMLELQSTLFDCVTKEKCYEIYAAALLASGDVGAIRLAGGVLSVSAAQRRPPPALPYERSLQLVLAASAEYFNSASSIADPALDLARCCLILIEDEHEDIRRELDFNDALKILTTFNLKILPIQFRLCGNKMSLIEECLKLNQNAYLASHKLLKLAKLLRIAGDDEQTREGMVLQRVCEEALDAGPRGAAAAVGAARRLAALRHAPAAPLLAAVARHPPARAHADRHARRALLAASAAHCHAAQLDGVLRARLALEIEDMEQLSTLVKTQRHLVASRYPSVEEEFSDAITTPVIENKDLVVPTQKVPIFNYLIETFQSNFHFDESAVRAPDEGADAGEGEARAAVRCPEFYRSLYPQHGAWGHGYDRFSASGAPRGVAGALLSWYCVQASLDDAHASAAAPLEALGTYAPTLRLVCSLTEQSTDCARYIKSIFKLTPLRS